MKHVIFVFLIVFASNYFCCKTDNTDLNNQDGRILKVPQEFATILDAIENSEDGDWIILAPGKYYEKGIKVDKAVTVSSEWKLNGDESIIDQTIIDSQDTILFTITSSGAEISGLNIINGDHTLNISSNVTISHNHFENNLDAMSFESGSGGYVGYNTVENDRDDGLDIDIGSEQDNIGSDILVEYNPNINSNDDGIEIRLFSYPYQNINYDIRKNTIIGSNNAGIQLISYDEFTGKVFYIHHNIIHGCKTALGCMEGSNTAEDMSGASKMDEKIYLYNNTLVGNKMGATGGNNILALNNIVFGNESGGFKRFGTGSAIVNNLFYQNGVDDFVELNESVVKNGNIFSMDPLLDNISYVPNINSPCIDAGTKTYELNGNIILEIASEYITGSAPDIGAIEYNRGK
jgi:hypothetical protein